VTTATSEQDAAQALPDPDRVGVIVVSAGASTRMAGVDKTMAPLAGMPLIARTIDVFERCDAVGAVVLIVSREVLNAVAETSQEYHWKKVLHIRLGGIRRQDSVRLGLRALPDCDWVVVHDGARPLVTDKTIREGLAAAQATGAATAAVPPVDTVKVVGNDGRVQATPDRRTLALIQTPQVFSRELIDRAHAEIGDDVTDDAAMIESMGLSVQVFMGDRTNIKVTNPEDLAVAEALLALRDASE
jgi:2-C-methyl-D-erythritol 4-phosphate cytidylyltransferase